MKIDPMNRELVVTMYKTIDALDQVYADMEWLEGEMKKDEALGPVDVPVDEDAHAEAHVIVEQLSLLHERGGARRGNARASSSGRRPRAGNELERPCSSAWTSSRRCRSACGSRW